MNFVWYMGVLLLWCENGELDCFVSEIKKKLMNFILINENEIIWFLNLNLR